MELPEEAIEDEDDPKALPSWVLVVGAFLGLAGALLLLLAAWLMTAEG
jgi:hypothetical protein